jgi:hypothetical protein
MTKTDLITLTTDTRALTAAEFQGLADVPPELEWLANLTNPKTRRAYQQDIQDFTAFVGISRPEALRLVTRPHVIAWRKDLERRTSRCLPSAASSPLFPPFLSISVSKTRWPTIRSMASSAPRRTTTRV